MFPELNNILNTSPDRCEQGQFILVSDSKTDGTFLIHHFISFYLKAGCRVCVLGLVQSFSHYSAVGQRLGVSLSQAREKGQLVFLEGLRGSLDVLLQDGPIPDTAQPLGFLRSPVPELRGLFEFVQSSLSSTEEERAAWGPPVLIVDDLSVLLSLGVSPGAVLDFVHYCRVAVCTRMQGNVVMLVHNEEELEDEGSELLLRSLTLQSSLTLQVQGLATGYCRDIHGQMELRWRGGSQGRPGRDQVKLFQYKVQDKGVSFFARGTSSAVL
ncbi:elongator complex protein 6 [Polyodon spathula]|uniref:elongator complex protein 6 n=1 Tax=Polyodon spathula TaxID=7913 RepID=UPI001B7EAACC|nr:elongator complex protein 6 [Polyodon spathula]